MWKNLLAFLKQLWAQVFKYALFDEIDTTTYAEGQTPMKVTLSNISSGYIPVTTLNANSDLIEDGFENTVSRDGTAPNHMLSNFDMNSYRILNVGTPVNATEVANKAYVDSVVSGAATGTLLALSSLTPAADQLPYFTSASAAALTTLTAAGRALLDDADAPAQLTTLGISSFIQTLLDDTTAAAARTTLGVSLGSGDLVSTNNLSDVSSASTARTNLGLAIGTNVQAYNSNLTAINQALTTTSSPSFTTVTANLTGVASSATSATTATHLAGGLGGQVPYQSAAGTTAMLANGTSGQVLQSNGTTAAPSWATIAGTGDMQAANNLSDVVSAATARTNLGLAIGTNVQAYDADLTTWAGVTPGTGIATALAVNVGSAGAPVLFNGAGGTPTSLTGTNISGTAASLTAGTATNLAGGAGGQVPYQSAAGTTAMLANGTAGQLLQSNGTTAAPSWVSASGTGDMLKADNLSGLASTATSRTNLGLGSISTQAASAVAITGGTASGLTNLVTSEFGSTLSTSTAGTTIPNNCFGGSWLTHTIVDYTDTATHGSDARIALGVTNYANPGSGTNGPTTSDYAGFFTTKKYDFANSANTNAGEVDGAYFVVAQSVLGDCAAVLADARKRSGSALYGCIAMEWASSLVNGSDTATTAIHGHQGWCYGDASQVYGYVAEAWTGTGTTAFLVDTYSTGAWTNAFAVRSSRSDGNLTFKITAAGLAQAASGSEAAPSWSFASDTNTGFWNSTADEMAFVTGGTSRYVMSSTALRPAADNTYTLGSASYKWSNVYCTTFTATSLGGTLTTAAQPNITSVGTLTSLTVSGGITGLASTATLAASAQQLKYDGTNTHTFTGTTSSSAAQTATFTGTKPGSTSPAGNVWIQLLQNGTTYWVPAWAN